MNVQDVEVQHQTGSIPASPGKTVETETQEQKHQRGYVVHHASII